MRDSFTETQDIERLNFGGGWFISKTSSRKLNMSGNHIKEMPGPEGLQVQNSVALTLSSDQFLIK